MYRHAAQIVLLPNPLALYRLLGLTLTNSTFCPHSVFMCFVWIWKQTAIISLYGINWLVCITETECVYCAVRTGSLNVIGVKLWPQSVHEWISHYYEFSSYHTIPQFDGSRKACSTHLPVWSPPSRCKLHDVANPDCVTGNQYGTVSAVLTKLFFDMYSWS